MGNKVQAKGLGQTDNRLMKTGMKTETSNLVSGDRKSHKMTIKKTTTKGGTKRA